MKIFAWIWFAIVQLLMFAATVLGYVVLPLFCKAQAWHPAPSSFDPSRIIDRWSFAPLNWLWGNPEDGVSGAQAKVWIDGNTQGSFMPDATPFSRAYNWSVRRNSADNLKYLFAWKNGPLKVWASGHKAGWQEENGRSVPVLS